MVLSTHTRTANEDMADVLIVGAGPAGLALANMLLRSGINPIIVDKLAAGQNTSRAAVIHAHTLEVLESIGVSERLVAEGFKLTQVSMRERDRLLLRLRFDKLPTRYNYLLMLPQDVTERILAEALAEAGGAVRWNCRVESLTETAEGIHATVLTSQGKQTLHARYVIGADGMNSLVRETAGIRFSGGSHEASFVLADVSMDWKHGNNEVMLFLSADGLLLIAPLKTDQYRVVASLGHAPAQLGLDDVQALIDNRGMTRGAGQIAQVHWSSHFHVHHRVADHFHRRRYLLIGDAAHVHSPAGGQGMNTGLVDACVLGRILSDVILKHKDYCALDHYDTLRKPAAEQVLQLAERLTRMTLIKSTPQRLLRNILLQTMGMFPAFRNRLQMELSGLSRRDSARIE